MSSATESLDDLIGPFATMPGGLLPALHAVQSQHGWIPPQAVAKLATLFNLGVAEVHGVVSFYHDFRSAPLDGPLLQVCRGEACQARGAEQVFATATARLAGRAHVEQVFCLGNCALGPSVRLADEIHAVAADVDPLTWFDEHVRGDRSPATTDGFDPNNDDRSVGLTVYVSDDTAARAAGSDEVAEACRAAGATVVRRGSRGALWLEPLIEVATADGEIAYGPCTAADVPAILGTAGGQHPLRLGLLDAHPWLSSQERVTFARVGRIDPLAPGDDFAAVRAALACTPDEVIATVTSSGLRGRGGAAFPAGIKWRTVADAAGTQKYVCANADEGDSGTFADRMLIEGDPLRLIEGMVIAGYAVGAETGYIYLRSEYPAAIERISAAIDVAAVAGLLGSSVLGSGVRFDIHLRVGAGAYICGEETAMLESLEGRRGVVRAKPPLPAHAGLFGAPTVINNVLTLATVPTLFLASPRQPSAQAGGQVEHAAPGAAYAQLGVGRSAGTQVFQLAGNVRRGGIVEVPFGITISELIEGYGGGTANGRPIGAVQIGGPLGAYLHPSQFGLSLDYETMAANGAMLGHGGVVVFDDTVDMPAQARFAMEFCAVESCGKCTPCRIGSTRGVEVLDAIIAGTHRSANLVLLDELCETMSAASLCAMGGLTPLPVRSAIRQWPEQFGGQP